MNWDLRPAKKFLRAAAPFLVTAAISICAVLACKYLLPFVLALLVAAMVWPIVNRLEKFRINRIFSSVVCLSGFYLIGATVVTALIIRTSQELLELAAAIPSLIKEADTLFSSLISQLHAAYLVLPADLAPFVDQALTQLASKGMIFAQDAAAWLLTGVSKMPGFFLVLIFAILSSYVITLDITNISQRFNSGLNLVTRQRINAVLKEMTGAVGNYLKAMLILIGITFGIALAGLTLIGVDYALVGSFVIAIADLLPVLGPGSIFIPWVIWLVASGETAKGLMMLGLYGFIFVFRQAVQPKVLSDTMELPALPLLIAIWIGLTQFGLAGLLLAPFVLVLYQAVGKALNSNLSAAEVALPAETADSPKE